MGEERVKGKEGKEEKKRIKRAIEVENSKYEIKRARHDAQWLVWFVFCCF